MDPEPSLRAPTPPLVNGGFQGNVTLTITQQATDPATINGYHCNLYLFPNGTMPGPDNSNPQARPRAGTTFVGSVEGSFLSRLDD